MFSDQACDLLSDAAAFYPQHLFPANVHKVENLANFYKLDEKLVGLQYLLFSQSIIYKNWKLDYENHQKNSTKTCWMCLPTLLKLFGQNNLHHLQARSQKFAMGGLFGGLEANGGLGAEPPLPDAGGLRAKPPAAEGTGVWGRSPQRSKILHFFAKITSF